MCQKLNQSLKFDQSVGESLLYSIDDSSHRIITNPETRYLFCQPQLIGYTINQKLLGATKDFVQYITKTRNAEKINIVNILRGGLNFPIEEACTGKHIDLQGISFVSSERVFLDDRVSRIESNYRKITVVPDATVIIGDIIASGETIKNVINLIVETYIKHNSEINRLFILTIGTDNALEAISEIEEKLKRRWPSFEGICVFFIEGVFLTYKDRGILGVNLPFVDFRPCGMLSVQYREALISNCHAIFEKCVIYDGGARRFEPEIHVSSHLSYWKSLMRLGSGINSEMVFCEKMGYDSFPSFEKWRMINHYCQIDENQLEDCYAKESECYKNLKRFSLG